MGEVFSRSDGPPVEEVKRYCESIIFVKFYGQTSSTSATSETDKAVPKDGELAELGGHLKELDAEARSHQPSEFEVTDKFKECLRKIADVRCHQEESETPDDCYVRLLKDAEFFKKIYRLRNRLSDKLDHDRYWGTRQQMLFGKVVADWLDKKENSDGVATDPIFGVLLNPTGGRVGPGDSGWFHNTLFDDYGHMAYHSAVHDGFGYLRTAHETGPGYNYLDCGWFGDWSPMGGQLSGIRFWKKTLGNNCPERNLHKFSKK